MSLPRLARDVAALRADVRHWSKYGRINILAAAAPEPHACLIGGTALLHCGEVDVDDHSRLGVGTPACEPNTGTDVRLKHTRPHAPWGGFKCGYHFDSKRRRPYKYVYHFVLLGR